MSSISVRRHNNVVSWLISKQFEMPTRHMKYPMLAPYVAWTIQQMAWQSHSNVIPWITCYAQAKQYFLSNNGRSDRKTQIQQRLNQMMTMIQEWTSQSIMTNLLPIRREKFAILNAQHTTALFQVTLPYQAGSENKALHIVVSKRPSYAIRVRNQHALPHDGSRGKCIEVHSMIRKSQCLVNLRREVAGVWESLMFSRLSKCIQCTIMQSHLWWLANYESYWFRGMRWRAMGSVWLDEPTSRTA